jgi:hypothetical protein
MATGPIDAVVAIHNAFRRDMAEIDAAALGGNLTRTRTSPSQSPGSHPQGGKDRPSRARDDQHERTVRCCHGIPAARLVTTMAQIRSVPAYPGSRPHRTAAFSRHARRPPDHPPNLSARNEGHEADHDSGFAQVRRMPGPSHNTPASARTSGSSARAIHRR